MSGISDVKAKRVTGTGALSVGRTRLKQVVVTVSAAGRLAITSGSGGETALDVDFGAAGTYTVLLMGNGILCDSDPYVATATNVTAATVVYG